MKRAGNEECDYLSAGGPGLGVRRLGAPEPVLSEAEVSRL